MGKHRKGKSTGEGKTWPYQILKQTTRPLQLKPLTHKQMYINRQTDGIQNPKIDSLLIFP